MSITVKIGDATDGGVSDAAVSSRPGIKVRLDIRTTLGGNLIIGDHPDIDIVVIPEKNKILTLAKRLNGGVVYGAQNRLFDFLKDRGVIDPTSIQGGNVFASLEGMIPEAPELPTIKIAVINIAKWLDEEKPIQDFIEEYEEEVVDDYTDPDKEYSTELGQVPQAAEKGSIRPSLVRGPYGLSLYNYYGY
jgi:hypothetical protein|tara:strand:- start:499 stop:1068 length:570 start_codon:yes stop_codon:yes gene_type:complete